MRRSAVFLLGLSLGLTGCANLPLIGPEVRDPLSPAEHTTLGDAYLSHGERRAAIEQYQAALERDKRYFPSLISLGNIAFEDKDWNKARKYFRRAYKADPGNAGAANNLAMVDATEGKHLKRARELITQALPTAGPLTPYLEDTLAMIDRRQKQGPEIR